MGAGVGGCAGERALADGAVYVESGGGSVASAGLCCWRGVWEGSGAGIGLEGLEGVGLGVGRVRVKDGLAMVPGLKRDW